MKILRQDDTGSEVAGLQKGLNNLGAGIVCDGEFDVYTAASLAEFQRAARLDVDAAFGPLTSDKLKNTQIELSSVKEYVRLLPVPYLSQRDNRYRPGSTCNITCVAMVLGYYGHPVIQNGKQLEDCLYEILTSEEAISYKDKNFAWGKNYPPYQIHAMLKWVLNKYGFMDASAAPSGLAEVKAYINADIPVILSGKFTRSGHLVTVVGFTQGGDLVVNDPYGDWLRKYKHSSGRNRLYPKEKLESLIFKDGRCNCIIPKRKGSSAKPAGSIVFDVSVVKNDIGTIANFGFAARRFHDLGYELWLYCQPGIDEFAKKLSEETGVPFKIAITNQSDADLYIGERTIRFAGNWDSDFIDQCLKMIEKGPWWR